MAELRYVTVQAAFTRADGQPATGWVSFAAVDTTAAPAADTIVTRQPFSVPLQAGRLPDDTRVLVGSDPSLTRPVLVRIDVLLDDTPPDPRIYLIDTAADTVDLADLVAVPVAGPDGPVAVVPWSAVGAPGGVAPLDSDRKVPAQYLPGGGFQHVQATPAAVWTVPHGLGFRPGGVEVFDPTYTQRFDEFGVQHLDENTLRISMDVPTAGVALIS